MRPAAAASKPRPCSRYDGSQVRARASPSRQRSRSGSRTARWCRSAGGRTRAPARAGSLPPACTSVRSVPSRPQISQPSATAATRRPARRIGAPAPLMGHQRHAQAGQQQADGGALVDQRDRQVALLVREPLVERVDRDREAGPSPAPRMTRETSSAVALEASATGNCTSDHNTAIASSSQRAGTRLPTKPTTAAEIENSQKSSPATTPNWVGVSCGRASAAPPPCRARPCRGS